MAPSSSPIICIPTHHHSPSLSVTVNVACSAYLFDSLLEQVGVYVKQLCYLFDSFGRFFLHTHKRRNCGNTSRIAMKPRRDETLRQQFSAHYLSYIISQCLCI